MEEISINGRADNPQENIPLISVLSEKNTDKEIFIKLLEAVYTGNDKQLISILEDPAFIPGLESSVDGNGSTPLHYTTFAGPCDGNKDIRRVLAEILLDYEKKTHSGKSILLYEADRFGNTPLHHASQYKQFSLVKLFLERGVDPSEITNSDGHTPLHLMADGKSPAALKSVKFMFEAVNPSNSVNMDGLIFEMSLLAAESGSEKILNYLVTEKNVNLERLDKSGLSVVHKCIVGKQKFSKEFLNLLLSKVGNQMAQNGYNDSLLHLAARVSNADVLEHIKPDLLEPFELKNRIGQTPFHCAIQGFDESAISCLKILLRMWKTMKLPRYQCEDFMAADSLGRTVVSIACENKAVQLIEYIITIKFDGLPYPWFSSETLAKIYATFPTALFAIMDQQIKVIPSSETGKALIGQGQVSLDFSCIVGYANNFKKERLNDSTAIHFVLDANKSARNKVLAHPMVKIFLRKKWLRFRWLALVWLFLQVILVSSYNFLTIFLYGRFNPNATTDGRVIETRTEDIADRSHIYALSGIILTLLMICILKESAQMWAHKWRYCLSPLNWIQLLFIAVAVMVIIDGFEGNVTDFSPKAGIAAFGSFFSVFLLIRDFGRLPGFERFFEVLIKVIFSSMKVLGFYLPCLVAFTLAFRVLMKRNENFHLPYGFIKIFSMAIGELDYENIATQQRESESLGHFLQIMYLIFAFLAAIVLINLLIAFAVSDIQALLIDAETSRLASQLRLVYDYEHFLRMVAKITAESFIEKNFFLESLYQTEVQDALSPDLHLQLKLSPSDPIKSISDSKS